MERTTIALIAVGFLIVIFIGLWLRRRFRGIDFTDVNSVKNAPFKKLKKALDKGVVIVGVHGQRFRFGSLENKFRTRREEKFKAMRPHEIEEAIRNIKENHARLLKHLCIEETVEKGEFILETIDGKRRWNDEV